jgi:hypothetical protein
MPSRRLLARNAALGQLSDAGWAARRPARKSAAADATFAKACATQKGHHCVRHFCVLASP